MIIDITCFSASHVQNIYRIVNGYIHIKNILIAFVFSALPHDNLCTICPCGNLNMLLYLTLSLYTMTHSTQYTCSILVNISKETRPNESLLPNVS